MTYDCIIIGGGPGGYIAAERAGGNGLSTLLIERSELGGVCLNEGCIPTKTLLNSAKLYAHGSHSSRFGVTFDNPKFDLAVAMAWKNEVIIKLRKGIEFLIKKNKVTVVKGTAILKSTGKVDVDGSVYESKNIIIATGSSVFVPPIPGADGKNVLTSTEMLQISQLPGSVAVIGGGVIGIEFASFFSSLGIKVSIIEMMPEIVPFMDYELAPVLRKALSGVEFHLSSKVTKVEKNNVHFTSGNSASSVEGELILMAAGRKPNLQNVGFESIGLDFNDHGVKVDERMRTNLPGVYAIGDVTGQWLLAHAASRMAEVAVNTIIGKKDMMRTHAVPWAVYSLPESAGVGMTEQDLKKAGVPYKKAVVPMRSNGRFLAENGDLPGVCKVIAHADTGILLGVHMTGSTCSEMIFGAATMIESELRVKEVSEIIFPHPSISETIRDAVLMLL